MHSIDPSLSVSFRDVIKTFYRSTLKYYNQISDYMMSRDKPQDDHKSHKT